MVAIYETKIKRAKSVTNEFTVPRQYKERTLKECQIRGHKRHGSVQINSLTIGVLPNEDNGRFGEADCLYQVQDSPKSIDFIIQIKPMIDEDLFNKLSPANREPIYLYYGIVKYKLAPYLASGLSAHIGNSILQNPENEPWTYWGLAPENYLPSFQPWGPWEYIPSQNIYDITVTTILHLDKGKTYQKPLVELVESLIQDGAFNEFKDVKATFRFR